MEPANVSPTILQDNVKISAPDMQAAAVESQADMSDDGWESQPMDDEKSLSCNDDDYNGWFDINVYIIHSYS